MTRARISTIKKPSRILSLLLDNETLEAYENIIHDKRKLSPVQLSYLMKFSCSAIFPKPLFSYTCDLAKYFELTVGRFITLEM